jgi:hypothetical protein
VIIQSLEHSFVFVVLPVFIERAFTQPLGVYGRLLQAFYKNYDTDELAR